jgi:hypothetical protein
MSFSVKSQREPTRISLDPSPLDVLTVLRGFCQRVMPDVQFSSMSYVFQSYPWTMHFNLIIGRLLDVVDFSRLLQSTHVTECLLLKQNSHSLCVVLGAILEQYDIFLTSYHTDLLVCQQKTKCEP